MRLCRGSCGGSLLGRTQIGDLTMTQNGPETHGGGRKILTGVNLLLAGVALTMGVVGIAGAQPGGESRRASGQYTCVGGATVGGYTNTVYVLDSANRELVALKWNDGTKQFEGVGYRDLDRDITAENER